MSFEAGLGLVEAVGQTVKQASAELSQAVIEAGQAQLAQSFEMGLTRASEAQAANFQAAEESRRRTADAARAIQQVSVPAKIDIFPQDTRGGLGDGISSYMEGFQSRAMSYPSELDDFVSKISDGAEMAGRDTRDAGAGNIAAKDTGLTAQKAMHILQRSFSFAIEAELISNASKHTTQVFNDLMKGE